MGDSNSQWDKKMQKVPFGGSAIWGMCQFWLIVRPRVKFLAPNWHFTQLALPPTSPRLGMSLIFYNVCFDPPPREKRNFWRKFFKRVKNPVVNRILRLSGILVDYIIWFWMIFILDLNKKFIEIFSRNLNPILMGDSKLLNRNW